MRISDWSSDVCSSDLERPHHPQPRRCDQGPQGTAQTAAGARCRRSVAAGGSADRRETRPARPRAAGAVLFLRPAPRSEEHTSELQSLMRISYAVFCLKKTTHKITTYNTLHELRTQSSAKYL